MLTTTDHHPALSGAADRMLSKKEVAAIVGVSVSTLDRMVKNEAFPRPQEISLRRVGWLLSTVQAWISSRPQRGS